MMLSIVPYRPAHLAALRLQAAQSYLQPLTKDASYRNILVVPDLAYSGFVGEDCVACIGILPLWPGRAQSWALIGEVPPKHWTQIVRACRAGLDRAAERGHRRIEAYVADGFAPGCKLARMLGFEVEALMECFAPDGSASLLYARIRP